MDEFNQFIEDFYNGDITQFYQVCSNMFDNNMVDALSLFDFWKEEKGTDVEGTSSTSSNQLPSYETDYDTVYTENMFGNYEGYTKYTSYNILYDIENTRGILSDGTKGMWYQVFYLMNYGTESVPEIVDCWKNDYNRIAFILPNGNIYMDDNCYAVLVANNITDENIRNSFFYDVVDLDYLGVYMATYGPPEVQIFLEGWYRLEEKKQDAINKWLDSWDYGPNY